MSGAIMQHWIQGQWVDSSQHAHTRRCLTGEPFQEFAMDDGMRAAEAIEHARRVFERSQWAHQPRLRAQVLLELADQLAAVQDELATRISIESGKLIHHARGEVMACISECRYYAGLARSIQGRVLETDAGKLSLFTQEAIGVASIIVPWNAPGTLLVRSLAPAMAAGCTSVVKGAMQTVSTTQLFAECLARCPSLPTGVVHIVHGDLACSQMLCQHPEVDVISFTGSTTTGKAIMASAASSLKRLSLELGGKSPAVVLEDADLDRAAHEIALGIVPLSGQMCTAIGRVLVADAIWDRFVPVLRDRLAQMKLGTPDDHTADLGPLIDVASAERYERLLAQANAEGEILLAGGRPSIGPLANFAAPALVAIENPHSTLVQTELFAPIGIVERFDTDADAAVLANVTRYGLSASVYSQSGERGQRMARAIKAGTVWINCHNRLMAEAETGGYRESGLGRLHGVEGLADFLETKHIYQEFGQLPTG
ncbi:MAG: aldehyde dehydrogenase family protein [Gammaproteobacteria bacterium]|nr:aldehyde dehydrogenase family protein [Gammaproteobacteria bacterium]